jgi:hypothetical protein
MAKTSKKKAAPVAVGRQAPVGAFTPEQLLAAFDNRTDEERIEAAKAAGILDAKGKLTPLYTKNWGNKVTRTPDAGA